MSGVETAWTDPQVGDICDAGDGRARKVTKVVYRSLRGFVGEDRRPGDWVDGVEYEAQGLTRSCAASTWANWCRAAVKAGGRYLRGGVDAGQF